MNQEVLEKIIKERSIIQVAFIQHITAIFSEFTD